jgi:hypothetical protein
LCRLWVQIDIELTWVQHPRWMGVFGARAVGNLGAIPWSLYLEVFREMVAAGDLIQTFGPGDMFPQYMLSRLTLPAASRRDD